MQVLRALWAVSREKRKLKIRIPSFLFSLGEKKISECEEGKVLDL